MKIIPLDLMAVLQAGGPFVMADLYTIALSSGEILRWTDFDADIFTGMNLMPYSNPNQSVWAMSGSKVTGFAITPDNSQQAVKVVENVAGTGSVWHYMVAPAPALSPSKTYTISILAKAGERNWVWLQGTGLNGAQFTAMFDVAAGVVGNTYGVGSSAIAPAAYGYYRCSISIPSNTGVSVCNVLAGVSNGNAIASYVGDGVKGAYFAGAQLDIGAMTAMTKTQGVAVSPYIYSSTGPVLKRGNTRNVIGLEVDTLDLSIFPKPTDTLDGLSLLAAARGGVFDGATLTLERAFLSSANTLIGSVILFGGRFADVTLGRTEIQIRVNSLVESLSIQLPRNLYQAGCVHTLWDSGCGLDRDAWGVAAHVAAGSTVSVINCELTNAARYFNRGYIRFINGALSGSKFTVKSYSAGILGLFMPMPSIPAVGDMFIAYPGCDKMQGTCDSTFNNKAQFKGCRFIPVPETAV